VRISTLRWAAGILCMALGAMVLVVPHQFSAPLYAALQPQWAYWGLAFLIVGAALLTLVPWAGGGRWKPPRISWLALSLLFFASGFAVVVPGRAPGAGACSG